MNLKSRLYHCHVFEAQWPGDVPLFIGACGDILGCMTDGNSVDDVQRLLVEKLERHILSCLDDVDERVPLQETDVFQAPSATVGEAFGKLTRTLDGWREDGAVVLSTTPFHAIVFPSGDPQKRGEQSESACMQ